MVKTDNFLRLIILDQQYKGLTSYEFSYSLVICEFTVIKNELSYPIMVEMRPTQKFILMKIRKNINSIKIENVLSSS